jgi:serine/threonine protein phosphatase 1
MSKPPKPGKLPASASRVIAIGDIHGCSTVLSALLDAIQPGPADIVISLGNVID